MKKVLSFSLFGNNELYTIGAIENAKMSSLIYPDWETRFYIGSDVNVDIVEQLKSYSNIVVIICEKLNDYDGLFWRFKPFYDSEVSIWISRDCDSRISHLEKKCVDEWLLTDKSVHIIRDSHNHVYEIMAGMFGVNNVLFKQRYGVIDLVNNFSNHREDDQTLLTKKLWPLIINDHLCHDYWNHNTPHTDITYQNSDTVHYNNAYDCGLLNYVLTERKKRHSNLYLNTDNRDLPKNVKTDFGLYIGQRIDINNNPIFDMVTRWEYELRGIKIK
jgi:hypothetical protein